MNNIVRTLHNTGLQVSVHVGGDEGIDMTLNAFEQALQVNPRVDPRHRIEHGLFPTSSAIQRMKQSNITLSTQHSGFHGMVKDTSSLLDSTTVSKLLPLKTISDLGIHIAFGCDVPASIFQNLNGLFWCSNSQKRTIEHNFNPGQKLTIRKPCAFILWAQLMPHFPNLQPVHWNR